MSALRVQGAGEAGLIAVPGALMWRNTADESTEAQLQVYGPGGRWERRTVHGVRISGASLVDDLIAQGATEGAQLLVLAANRFQQPLTPDQLVRLVRSVSPELLTEEDRA